MGSDGLFSSQPRRHPAEDGHTGLFLVGLLNHPPWMNLGLRASTNVIDMGVRGLPDLDRIQSDH